MKKKTVKILLHHDVMDSVKTDHPAHSISWVKRALFGLLNSIIAIAYAVGLTIVTIIKSPIWLFQLAQNRQPESYQTFGKRITAFVILLILAASPFLAVSTLSNGWELGGRVLGVSDGALGDLTLAQEAIANKDYTLAQNKFSDALAKLETVQTDLDRSSALIQAGSKLAPASFNTGNLLTAAKLLTEAGLSASELLDQLNRLTFTAEGLTSQDGESSEQAVKKLAENGRKINENITRASELLAPINSSFLPAEYQVAITQAQTLLTNLSEQTKPIQELSTLLTDLVLGSKSFLVILQNNNELRANGGFIGTVAQGHIDNGVISSLDIRTVYDIDGQLLEWVKPPTPLRAVTPRLFMRDSNWFANFPDSAQRISALYEKSGGETPDLIFAFTPDLFIDFLDQTGPIQLPTYGVTLTAENFIEQTQTSTSVAYNKDLNQPKQLLADLYPALMQRLGELSKGEPLLLLQILQKHLAQKNILVYSRNTDLQNKFSHYRWSGEVTNSEGDYLQINSSNLNGSKTDRALKRSVNLQTTIEEDGRVIDKLVYTVENPLPQLGGLTNKSWVRFFVPAGSKLLGSSGFSDTQLTELTSNQNYTTNEFVESWNNSLRTEPGQLIQTGSEAGKTILAGWVEVPGGATANVTITYELPFRLDGHSSAYSLVWEKQPGMQPLEAKQQIDFPGRDSIWVSPSLEAASKSGTQLQWQTSLTTDHFGGLIMKQQ